MSQTLRVLVVDDEEIIRDVLETLLEREGYDVTAVETGTEALKAFEADPHDLVLLDLMLPDRSGLEVLREIRQRDPDAVVVIVTAYSSIEGAIEAMREGAFHYIPKPFQNQEVLLTVEKGAERRKLTEENRRLRQELSRRYGLGRIVGKSEAMRKVFDLVRLAGPSKSTILVEGESGTGKELVARAIHTHSPRAGAPFVTVNSGSMPTDLLESNLFGHVRGAFTGAIANKKGLFEVADGGSIFFDEIGTVSLETQAKLLRVIQEKEFMRVGSVDTQKADVRIIAATNVDLKKMVGEGRFRDDLYYRLCVITIAIPPLRERAEDVPLLADHFVRLYASENNKAITGLHSDLMKALLDYDWPGNVRELENAIERAVVLCPGGVIGLELLPETVLTPDRAEVPIRLPENGSTYKDLVEDYERRLVRTALRRTGGVQKRAAELLRMKPTTLHEIIKRLEIRDN
ncbi:MAG TPA: sigma-54 dependent transcriptional regulator [Thermoanaerobaculia bacterium]|jgi:DNA-binding NtrC family response regulator|nr:sigma-54 dependent transcriptional regulator [Thermoanaerobaculia bacterium]